MIRRVAVLGHPRRPAVRRAARTLIASLARRGLEVRVARDLAGHLGLAGHPPRALGAWCQLMVTLGGDGTALAGGRALAGRRGALLAVNHGGLGFLTAAEAGEQAAAVRAALSGAWPVVARRLVAATVRRGGRIVRRGLAVNDAVLKSQGGYAAVHLRSRALGQDLGHLVADGLIAASASGSTAYSLSAGGPLLAPDVEALVVTPVCAHSLGSRTLLLAPGAPLEVEVLGSYDRAVLLLDGQERSELEPGDRVSVTLGRAAVRRVQNPARPFAHALQAKLGWQGSAKRSF
jgi:NAD+ kinase